MGHPKPKLSQFSKAGIPEPDLTTAALATPYPTNPIVREWRDGFSFLSPDLDPCPGFSFLNPWSRVYAAVLDFLNHHAEAAAALGWTDIALFGVHESAGLRRAISCGALMTAQGSQVVEVARDGLRFMNRTRYRRIPPGERSIPVWDFMGKVTVQSAETGQPGLDQLSPGAVKQLSHWPDWSTPSASEPAMVEVEELPNPISLLR